MIFYFSGTGNSKWIAEEIAHKTNDKAVDIMHSENYNNSQHEVIGIVFPVYAWAPPEPVLDFVKKLHSAGQFTFGVCTCGDEAGLSMETINKYLHLDSCYSIKMPSNYIMASNIESDEIIKDKIAKARIELDLITQEVMARKKVYRVNKGKMAGVKSKLASVGFNNFARTTKPFSVSNECSGCGKCARECPAGTIEMIDHKPRWRKKCYQCLGCINLCPQQAIQYGKGTINKKRYRLGDYL